jgi:hypothetical protein
MITRIHATAGSLGLALIATFFTATTVVELFGDEDAIAAVKRWILYGVAVLIPLMMITGGSGRYLMGHRRGPLVRTKLRRMIVIALIGLAVLTPCAVLLQRLSADGDFGAMFTAVQIVELAGGAVNICLMSLNIRDGMLLTGRIRRRRVSKVRAS